MPDDTPLDLEFHDAPAAQSAAADEEPLDLKFEGQAGSTKSAGGRTTDSGKGRVFPCEQCGADLVFHVGRQSLRCEFCGYVKNLEIAAEARVVEQDFHAMVARMRELHEQGHKPEDLGSEVRCESCGGNVLFQGTLTSSECPYCGVPIQRENIHDAEHRVSVDAVLPFEVSHDQAQKNLVEWIRSRWFAPNDFLERGADGKFNGVYLPYWTFDSMTSSSYSGERGEHYYVTVGTGKEQRQERRTRWFPASGAFQRFFDDVLTEAVKGMNRDLILELEPWPLDRCLPFTQEVLAGFLARTYDVELEQSFPDAQQRMRTAIEQEVRQRIGGDEQRVHKIQTRFDAITFKHLLLPVWLMAYRYHDQAYQVMVNAGTGEVQGERPWSCAKITFAVLAGIAAIGTFAILFSQA